MSAPLFVLLSVMAADVYGAGQMRAGQLQWHWQTGLEAGVGLRVVEWEGETSLRREGSKMDLES